MQRETLSTFKLVNLLVAILLLTSACASSSTKFDGFSPVEKIFAEDFEKVWRAAQISLQKYPMRVNNIDKGLLETDWIKGHQLFKPVANGPKPAGLKYKLVLRTIRGNLAKEPSVKVTIQKRIEKQRDFFANVDKLPSDGFEEKVILYRIQRELTIDNALEIAQEQEDQEF